MLPDGAAAYCGTAIKNGDWVHGCPLLNPRKWKYRFRSRGSPPFLLRPPSPMLSFASPAILKGGKSRSPAVRIRDGAPVGPRGGLRPSGERDACCERIAAVRSSPFLDNTSLAADAPIGVSHGAQLIGGGAIRSAISSGEAAGSPLSNTGISKILVPRGARRQCRRWLPLWWRKTRPRRPIRRSSRLGPRGRG